MYDTSDYKGDLFTGIVTLDAKKPLDGAQVDLVEYLKTTGKITQE
jgi:hypothetical protein